jgi:hypothetical protein
VIGVGYCLSCIKSHDKLKNNDDSSGEFVQEFAKKKNHSRVVLKRCLRICSLKIEKNKNFCHDIRSNAWDSNVMYLEI